MMPETKTTLEEPFYGSWNRVILKLKYSLYSTLVFFLFANPETYRIMQNIVGRFITIISENGVPTAPGFFVHSGMFFITMLALMLIPSE